MQRKYDKLTLATNSDADWRAFVEKDRCPSCDGDTSHIETVEDESTYVDDEAMYLTQYGPRFVPYKTWVCGNCGSEFRTILGVVAIHVTKEPDVEMD